MLSMFKNKVMNSKIIILIGLIVSVIAISRLMKHKMFSSKKGSDTQLIEKDAGAVDTNAVKTMSVVTEVAEPLSTPDNINNNSQIVNPKKVTNATTLQDLPVATSEIVPAK
jgi:hypothetical protein